MCGNEMSTIVVPVSENDFIAWVRGQLPTGRVSIKNSANGSGMQPISLN